jgi:hypothetical protein
MEINFGPGLQGYQNALKLKLILDYYEQTHGAGSLPDDFLSPLRGQIDSFLSRPEFEKFRSDHAQGNTGEQMTGYGLLTRLGGLWRWLMGPSQREMQLSQQRRNLIERAEHAEQMAFEALAETADVGRQRDQALERLKELESELAQLKADSE